MEPRFKPRYSAFMSLKAQPSPSMAFLIFTLLAFSDVSIHSSILSSIQPCNVEIHFCSGAGTCVCVYVCMYVILTIYITLLIFQSKPHGITSKCQIASNVAFQRLVWSYPPLWFCVSTSQPQGFSLIVLYTFPLNGCRPKAEDS